MRFDDTLDTVMTADVANPLAAEAAWRQLVDLVGRGRAPSDGAAMLALEELRPRVPVAVRAASARALVGANAPASLVRMLASDEMAVASPFLRAVLLPTAEWIALLPGLSPAARAVLRHRRDLPDEVNRALASFGPVDFVLGEPAEQAESAPAPPSISGDTGPFVAVGVVAKSVVAEARRRENDNEAPAQADGPFRIADIVARIDAFRETREQNQAAAEPHAPAPAPAGFRFETDVTGTLRWVVGAERGALIGLSIARPAVPRAAGVDGVASGAFRRRTSFDDARLLVAGSGEAGGAWRISAVPAFDTATGRFLGYRGTGRRPSAHEAPELGIDSADAMRQLVHELRTPTNAIVGFSEMIEHQLLGPVPEVYRQQAVAMRDDAGSLLAAIDDLDTAARIASGALSLRPEPIALSPLMTRLAANLASLAARRGARLEIAATDVAVQGDVLAIERLIARLFASMLATAQGGEIIGARVHAVGPNIVLAIDRPAALAAHPGEAVLGIDDEREGGGPLLGTGFALRLARNLARELGGTLRFGGHSLTLRLPAALDHPMEKVRRN